MCENLVPKENSRFMVLLFSNVANSIFFKSVNMSRVFLFNFLSSKQL